MSLRNVRINIDSINTRWIMTGFVYWKTHICVCVAQLTAKQRRLQPPATSNTHSNVPMCSFCKRQKKHTNSIACCQQAYPVIWSCTGSLYAADKPTEITAGFVCARRRPPRLFPRSAVGFTGRYKTEQDHQTTKGCPTQPASCVLRFTQDSVHGSDVMRIEEGGEGWERAKM